MSPSQPTTNPYQAHDTESRKVASRPKRENMVARSFLDELKSLVEPNTFDYLANDPSIRQHAYRAGVKAAIPR